MFHLGYTTCKYVGPIDMFVVPNPNKLKECYAEMMNQVSQFANPDYFTDEQLKRRQINFAAQQHP